MVSRLFYNCCEVVNLLRILFVFGNIQANSDIPGYGPSLSRMAVVELFTTQISFPDFVFLLFLLTSSFSANALSILSSLLRSHLFVKFT